MRNFLLGGAYTLFFYMNAMDEHILHTREKMMFSYWNQRHFTLQSKPFPLQGLWSQDATVRYSNILFKCDNNAIVMGTVSSTSEDSDDICYVTNTTSQSNCWINKRDLLKHIENNTPLNIPGELILKCMLKYMRVTCPLSTLEWEKFAVNRNYTKCVGMLKNGEGVNCGSTNLYIFELYPLPNVQRMHALHDLNFCFVKID